MDRHYSFGMSRLVAILSILVRPYFVLRVPGIPQTLGRVVVVSVLLLGTPLKSFLAHNFGLDQAVGGEGMSAYRIYGHADHFRVRVNWR